MLQQMLWNLLTKPLLSQFCRLGPGWSNTGYIFPEGFESRVHFRSSVALDQLCVHECSVVGRGGQYWPGPTFIVRAMDRADEPRPGELTAGVRTELTQSGTVPGRPGDGASASGAAGRSA